MRTHLGLLAVLLFFGGCSYFNDPGAELILNLDNEFEISMVENLMPSSRELIFVLTSLDEIQCQESELILSSEKGSGFVKLRIDDINISADCGDDASYPSGEISMPVRNANYTLTIQVKDHTSQNGSLIVTGDYYKVNLDNTKGLILVNDHINRIPNNFAWGYYQATNDQALETIKSFLSENNLITRPMTYLKEGFYSYFSIDASGNIKFDSLPYSGTVEKLAFDNIDMAKAQDLVRNFKLENPDLLFTMSFSDGSIL